MKCLCDFTSSRHFLLTCSTLIEDCMSDSEIAVAMIQSYRRAAASFLSSINRSRPTAINDTPDTTSNAVVSHSSPMSSSSSDEDDDDYENSAPSRLAPPPSTDGHLDLDGDEVPTFTASSMPDVDFKLNVCLNSWFLHNYEVVWRSLEDLRANVRTAAFNCVAFFMATDMKCL